MPQGKLLVVSGPSGVGKRTLVEHVLANVPGCWLSVSWTTREPRGSEKDGVDYHFVPRGRFTALDNFGGFLESAEFADEWYGTPRAPVEAKLTQGVTVIAEVDLQGAKQIKERMRSASTIFIEPPGSGQEEQLAELRKRILGRGRMPQEKLESRLETAKVELAESGWFEHHVLNGDLELARADMLMRVKRILSLKRQRFL